MRITKLIEQFENCFPLTTIGEVKDNKTLERIQSFIQLYPFLLKDKDYIDYLTNYSGLAYYEKNKKKDFTLFGLDGSTIDFLTNEFDEEFIHEQKGYMIFGYLSCDKSNSIKDFCFDITKNDRLHVFSYSYSLIEDNTKKEYSYLCNTFYDFLKMIINDKV